MTKKESFNIKRGMDKMYQYCDLNILIGLNVYLGNIREPSIEKQPYLFTRKLLSRPEAESLYGKWSRWPSVPLLKRDFFAINSDYRPYNNWTLTGFRENFVEEIKFYDKWNNNFMVMLNGTCMFPVKMIEGQFSTMPLSSILGICEYPVIKGDNEEIVNFAYSRSVPSKGRVEQQLFDEMVKAIVWKTRQSYRPPMANLTGEELSSDIFDPATVWDDVDPDKIKPLIPAGGVTSSEFQMTQFIKEIIDQKSVSPVFEGQEPNDRATATQIIEQRRASMNKMGTTILGVVNFEKKRTYLRICNIITHWTLPQKVKDGLTSLQNEYQTISMEAGGDDGVGTNIYKLQENVPEPSQVSAEDGIMSLIKGKKIRHFYIDPKELQKTITFNWYITINPTPKQDSALKVAQYAEFLKNAMAMSQMFGIQIKGEEALTRYAVLSQEDPERIFQFQPQQQAGMPMMPGQQPGQPGQPPMQGSQMMSQLMPKNMTNPSVNQMVNQ
jgi:hypothetical protein